MKIDRLHDWSLTPKEAQQIQDSLRWRLQLTGSLTSVRAVAGIDASISGNTVIAAVVVLSYPEMQLLEVRSAARQLTFPYIPGLLSFREAPAILSALEIIRTEPDLVVVDGHAIAHPRRFGIGAHIGLLIDKPTLGCAKTKLVGDHLPVGEQPGDFQYLRDRGEIIGAVVRTRAGTKPVYVSVGHRMDLDTAMSYLLSTGRGYRLPEPIRQAHLAAGGKLNLKVLGQPAAEGSID